MNILYIIENKYLLEKIISAWDIQFPSLRENIQKNINSFETNIKFYYKKIKLVVNFKV